jgi:hypothetical protein
MPLKLESNTAISVQNSTGRAEMVRKALKEAVKNMGGTTVAAYRAGVHEQSIWNWLRAGKLDRVPTAQAFKFARAAGVPLETFLLDYNPRQ